MTTSMSAPALRPNKGFHPILERDNPYLFIDACMQAWPDADYANAHRHGVAAYASAIGEYAEAVSGDVRSPKRALRDFNSYPQVVDLAEALRGRNYTEADVQKILGSNFLRVFEQVWK